MKWLTASFNRLGKYRNQGYSKVMLLNAIIKEKYMDQAANKKISNQVFDTIGDYSIVMAFEDLQPVLKC